MKIAFEIHDLALEGTPVVNRHNEPILTDDGPLLKRDLTNANKSLEHIVKLTGLMTEKRDITTRRHIDDMDEEELAAEIAKTKAEIAKLKANDNNGLEKTDLSSPGHNKGKSKVIH